MQLRKDKLLTKFGISLLLITLVFFAKPGVVFAGMFDFASGAVDTDEIMDDVFEKMGVNEDELQYTMKSLNTSRQKVIAPQVSISFFPSNPVPGEKVTAVASPSYFMNETKNLYFTWFLKGKENKDLDEDGDKDIEDYKIRAARIIASADFEWEKVVYRQKNGCFSFSLGNKAYKATLGGNDQAGKNDYCYIQDVPTGNIYEIGCGHLFAYKKMDCNVPKLCTSFFEPVDTGDGKYCPTEEEFWHTDPENPDTAGTGNGDEANVVGLGVDSFSWIYQEGDKVGVAVEGISIATNQESDSSGRIMWALSKNKCDIDADLMENKEPDDRIDMDTDDINNCLEDNLISPTESAEAQKLEVDLSYSPESPINDPVADSNEGDELTLTSTVLNADDNNFLKYTWEVFASDEIDPDSWGSALAKSDLPEATQMIGLGLSTFKFKLSLTDPKDYLKIKLTVNENDSANGAVRKGVASIVIPISTTSERIVAHKVSVPNIDTLELNLGNEICNIETADKAVCRVAKNEIIGLTVSSSWTDFLWTINGKPIDCQDNICSGAKQTNTAYFPVLKENGEQYTVALSATDQATGKKVNLTRVFKVTDPEIKIVSADETVCKAVLLGNYVDVDNVTWKDYSKLNFWGMAGSPIKLKPQTVGFHGATPEYVWVIDGKTMDAATADYYGIDIAADGTITLPAKDTGETYSVAVGAIYAQSNLVKKALNYYWGVTYDQYFEKNIATNIIITMQESAPAITQSPTKKIFAAAFTSLPDYLGFLLRIVLTAGLILFVSSFVLKFSLKREE